MQVGTILAETTESCGRSVASRSYRGITALYIVKGRHMQAGGIPHLLVDQVDATLKAERRRVIFDLYLACYSLEDIAERVGVVKSVVSSELALCSEMEALPKANKVLAEFSESDWSPPLYNIWSFSKSTNEVAHFGNSEQRFLDQARFPGRGAHAGIVARLHAREDRGIVTGQAGGQVVGRFSVVLYQASQRTLILL